MSDKNLLKFSMLAMIFSSVTTFGVLDRYNSPKVDHISIIQNELNKEIKKQIVFLDNGNFFDNEKEYKKEFSLTDLEIPPRSFLCKQHPCGQEIHHRIKSIIQKSQIKCVDGLLETKSCQILKDEEDIDENIEANWDDLSSVLARMGLGLCVKRSNHINNTTIKQHTMSQNPSQCAQNENYALSNRVGIWAGVPKNIEDGEVYKLSLSSLSQWSKKRAVLE